MWMMACGDASEFNNGRKLRPLMPRPTSSILTRDSFSAIAYNSHSTPIHKANLSTLNDHLATTKEQSKPEINPVPLVTSRWSPTPEQLYGLKEMYRRGLRTPTSDQIHQIAAKFRQFGKIEGKNVFYWFQNHKARERQRRRRMLMDSSSSEGQRCHDVQNLERNESSYEVVRTKNKATSPNGSTLSEESIPNHRAVASQSGTDVWIQFEERELQQMINRSAVITNHANCHLIMKPSCTPPIHFMNTMTSTTKTSPQTLEKMDPKPSNDEKTQTQMLQLFPIRSNGRYVINLESNNTDESAEAVDTSTFTPNQFFEFLPLKN